MLPPTEVIDTPESTDGAGIENAANNAYDSVEDVQDIPEVTEVKEDSVVETEAPTEEATDVSSLEESEESFTSLNPDDIPEALKPMAKSLQADYTKKRQAESERVSELEKKLDGLSEAQDKVKEVNDLIARANAGDEMAYRQLMQMNQAKAESEEDRIKRIVQQERDESFYKEARTEYPKLDKRLDETSPSYDPVLDTWLKANLATAFDKHWENDGTSNGFDYRANAKSLTGKWDKYIVDGNTAYLKRQSEMAKKKSSETRKKSPKTSSADSSPNKKMGLEESIEAAFDSQD